MAQSKRILIVEDEPLIAMMLEDFLDALGHVTVAVCDSVASALAVVAQGGLDAVLLDVNLSGEKSFPVADALAAAGIPFLFATGGDGHAVPPEHRDRPGLVKPYTIEALRIALDAL